MSEPGAQAQPFSPEALLEDLRAAGEERATALLVRHAERELVESAGDFLEAGLTPAGRRDAYLLGQALGGFRRIVAFHSPVRRCADTAAQAIQGARSSGSKARLGGVLWELGGPYLRDPRWAFGEFVAHRKGFIRAWFDGRYPDARIASRRETAEVQLRAILRSWEPTPLDMLRLYVTHDWNILAIREEVLGLRFEEAGWVGYLEGLVLVRDQRDLLVCQGGREGRLSVSELSQSG